MQTAQQHECAEQRKPLLRGSLASDDSLWIQRCAGVFLLFVLCGSLFAQESNQVGDGSDLTPAPAVSFSEREWKRIRQLTPLPDSKSSGARDATNEWASDERAANLGRALFFDTGLSANGKISCASCHIPSQGFADGLQVAEGLGVGTRNTPSLWNASHQRWYYWDGRADSLWSQALQPIENSLEMGNTRLGALRHIRQHPQYGSVWQELFGQLPELTDTMRFPERARPLPEQPEHPDHLAWLAMSESDRALVDQHFARLGKALAAFEMSLQSPPSPFDVFVAQAASSADVADTPHETGAPVSDSGFSASAQRGLKLFIGKANCRSCHSGPMLSDGEFHNLQFTGPGGRPPKDPGRQRGVERLLRDPFNSRGAHSAAPAGERAESTRSIARSPDLWGQFKTPSLRNLAHTAPYMHDGRFAALDDVLHFYNTLEGSLPAGHHQELLLVPLGLQPDELADLKSFLLSTSAQIQPEWLRERGFELATAGPKDPSEETNTAAEPSEAD